MSAARAKNNFITVIPPAEQQASATTPANPAAQLKRVARRLRRVCDLIDDGQDITLDQAELTQLANGLTQVEALLKKRMGKIDPKKRKAKPLNVQPDHLKILKWINERKYVTTGHVQTYLLVEKAIARLRELEKAKLLYGFRYETHKGQKSEKCYWLTFAGATYLQNKGVKARYDSHLIKEPPAPEDVYFKTMELELPRQARLANWKVFEPQVYNSVNPKGDKQTTQTTALANGLQRQEERQIKEAMGRGEIVTARLEAFKKNKHLACVPFQVNHHVCYIPDSEFAMVFILCPLLVNGQFWQARIAEYQELAKRLKVWAVFYTREHAEVWAEPINEAELGIATMASLPQLFADFSP